MEKRFLIAFIIAVSTYFIVGLLVGMALLAIPELSERAFFHGLGTALFVPELIPLTVSTMVLFVWGVIEAVAFVFRRKSEYVHQWGYPVPWWT